MGSPAESPHAEYDRWIARRERWGARFALFGRTVFAIVAVVLTVALVVLLIVTLIDVAQPRVWGTFTQTGCEASARRGCRPFGTWASDDRTIVWSHVYLNGWTDGSGRTRAAYQPTAILGSDVVNAPVFTFAGPVLTGFLLVWWGVVVLRTAASWGYIAFPRSRWLGGRGGPRKRQGTLGIRGSFRRQYRQSLARAGAEDSRAEP